MKVAKYFAVLALSAVVGAGIVLINQPSSIAAAPEGAPQAMPISVSTALEQDITDWSEFSGRLKAAEDVQIRPRVSGAIEQLHFKEGDLVQKGAKLFTIDLRPYKAAFDQAAAEVDGAEANLELAVHEKDRAKSLLADKAISQKEFDEKNNASKSAWAQLKAAKAARDIASLNLEYAEITAPISGRVGRPEITVGNIVQAGQSILTTIQSIDPVYADFDMDEQTYLRALKSVRTDNKGGEMKVFMALADETEFKREGKIKSFDNQLSGNSGTLRVRAEFTNTDGLLTPGLFARIHLGSADMRKAVLINDSAIGTDQSRKFVYGVDAEGNVSYKPVTLGSVTKDGLRIVESGLAAGEKIIVNGLMRVHPGMKVQGMDVDMNTLKPAGAPADAAAPAQQ